MFFYLPSLLITISPHGGTIAITTLDISYNRELEEKIVLSSKEGDVGNRK